MRTKLGTRRLLWCYVNDGFRNIIPRYLGDAEVAQALESVRGARDSQFIKQLLLDLKSQAPFKPEGRILQSTHQPLFTRMRVPKSREIEIHFGRALFCAREIKVK
jgi:hypothetical protein